LSVLEVGLSTPQDKGKTMTTIIERPSGDSGGGVTLIALVVGAVAAGVVGLFAFGAFDAKTPTSTSVTIEQPAAPSPAAPAATPPAQGAASPPEQPAPDAPAATPDTAPSEPTAPPAN
jgi:hypothetical protein